MSLLEKYWSTMKLFSTTFVYLFLDVIEISQSLEYWFKDKRLNEVFYENVLA